MVVLSHLVKIKIANRHSAKKFDMTVQAATMFMNFSEFFFFIKKICHLYFIHLKVDCIKRKNYKFHTSKSMYF